MAHFIRILKARSLEYKWKDYLNEKGIAYEEQDSDDELSEEIELQEEFTTVWWFTNSRKSQNSVENLIRKSLTGFIGGVLLTYIFFFFLYVGISFSLKTTTSICTLAGIILCLGFAFSSIIRFHVLLFLPVFFSKEGRQVLLTYALFLAFTGPGSNAMHNMGILTNSMTCGQEMVKRTLKQIFDMVKTPFRSSKESLEKITKALKEVILIFKQFVMKMERLIVSIYGVIKNANTWLRSIVNLCNNKMGTPFQRCMKSFDDVIADCKAKLGVISCLCHVMHIVNSICYSVKGLDFVCIYTEFVSDRILAVGKKRLNEFNNRMKNLFYVSVEFCDSFELGKLSRNTTKEVGKTSFEKIAKTVEFLQSMFSFFGFVFILLFVFLFFKVYSYKYKFLSSDQYDNVYISQYIVELDVKRAQTGRETVLPLEPRERKKYAKPSAIRLLEIEKTRIAQSMSFLSLTSFKIFTFLVFDYSLFWVLFTIYKTGYDETGEVEKSKFGIHVQGDGVLANFYRSLGKTFQVPENPNMHLTPIHCLPDPVQPDTGRYIQIGFLVVLCWILTMTEAYGLRLRNVVMSHYYPDRARQRAIWLYNHILRSRGSFLRYARRQLRKKYCGQLEQMERLSLTKRLFANFPLLGALCGGSEENNCLICGPPETITGHLKRCKTPDCIGRYCLQCYDTLQNVCTICQHPIEYGDISDISEEIDSSEDDLGNGKNCESGDSEKEKFLTFKEMEVRDRFRDVEFNRAPDYAKLGDLYYDKKALKKRLKAVLQRHIQNAKKEKNERCNTKQSIIKQIRLKVEDMISNLKRKKSRENTIKRTKLKKKFAEKIEILKDLKRKEKEEEEEEEKCMLQEAPKCLKSRVYFKLDPEIHEVPEIDYKTLKEKVREKIERLKENKILRSKEWRGSTGRNKCSESIKGDNKSRSEYSDDSCKKNFESYYHVEREKEFLSGEQTRSDGKSASKESCLGNKRSPDENVLL